jgi:hypothetical protein
MGGEDNMRKSDAWLSRRIATKRLGARGLKTKKREVSSENGSRTSLGAFRVIFELGDKLEDGGEAWAFQ